MGEENENEVSVTKWDSNSAKNSIDDGIRKIFTEKYDYVEKTSLIDARIALSAVAVAFALFALLWDWLHPFPESRNVLIVCVVAYFFFIGLLQLFLSYYERGIFYVGIDRDPSKRKPDFTWSFSSKMNKYDHFYNLELTGTFGNQTVNGKLSKSISSWITEDGKLLLDLLSKDVVKLHESLKMERKTK